MPTRGASPGLSHSSLSKCQVQAACRTHSGNCFYFSNLTLRSLQFQAPWLRGSQLARPTSGRTWHWIHNLQGVCLQDPRGSSSLTSSNPRTISTCSEDTLTHLSNNWVMSLKPSASFQMLPKPEEPLSRPHGSLLAGELTAACTYPTDGLETWGRMSLVAPAWSCGAVLPRSCCSVSKGPSLY